MTVTVSYRGQRADGTNTTGLVTTADLPGFVKDRFNWGWRWLRAEQGSTVVAAIEKIDGKRTWWAEEATL